MRTFGGGIEGWNFLIISKLTLFITGKEAFILGAL